MTQFSQQAKTETASTAGIDKTVLLIDGLNTFIRSFQVVPITNDDGEHFGAVYGFLNSLRMLVDKFGPTEVVVAWDGPKSGLRRKELFPAYKAHRRDAAWKRGSVRAFDFNSENEQSNNFVMQMNRTFEYIENLPLKFSRLPFVEADDVIAQYVKKLGPNDTAVIVSTDADFRQLLTVSPRILQYNPITKKLHSHTSFFKDSGYLAENFVFMKTVMGDKSDNIPGVRGIGKKPLCGCFHGCLNPSQRWIVFLMMHKEL